MTKVEALKALYEAMGGDPDDVAAIHTIAPMIAAIAAIVDNNGGIA